MPCKDGGKERWWVNLIVICLDTFRQDHVSCYHGGQPVFDDVPPCQTPNIDAFARSCVVFENAYPCGLPTIPVRYELMTGMFGLPYRGWEPLNPSDKSLAEFLRSEGYICGIVSDNYHYFRPYWRTAGMNYHRGFHSYLWVRGQEYDAYASNLPRRKVDDYVNEHYPPEWRERVAQFLANTDDFTDERHYFPAQVVELAIDWLKKNRTHRKVFLWVDSFDPHEPWDPPPSFDTYTDPAYKGPRLILPMGGNAADWATPEQIRLIRGLYAGECAFVDHCLGWLFDALKDLGYMDDSIVVLLADHGHPLADHGKFLKGTDRLYSELLKVPFLIYAPDLTPRRTKALVQFPDLLPTLLELLGMANLADLCTGKSFAAVLRGETDTHRRAVICGYHEAVDRCLRDETWSYIVRPDGQPDELYNLADDPKETRNLIDEHPEEARRLARQFGRLWFRRPPTEVKGVQGRYELL